MLLPVSALYILVFSFLFVLLSLNVITLRQKHSIAFGDGDRDDLRRAISAHANFTQYVPLMMILMALSEISGLNAGMLHLLGFLGLYSRGCHFYGILIYEPNAEEGKDALRFRKTGMVGTFSFIIINAILLLFHNYM